MSENEWEVRLKKSDGRLKTTIENKAFHSSFLSAVLPLHLHKRLEYNQKRITNEHNKTRSDSLPSLLTEVTLAG